MNFAAFEFALMIKADAGERGEQSAVGGETGVGENFGAARLVVIFHEAGEIALALGEGGEAVANLREIDVADGVVENFVVGVGKTEIEEALFGAPVGFGEEGRGWARRRGLRTRILFRVWVRCRGGDASRRRKFC